MLRTSFEIFTGIGPSTAAKLTSAGLSNWDVLLARPEAAPLGDKRTKRLLQEIVSAKQEFAQGNARHFESLLKPRDAWRLFSAFAEKCLCYDIETTGLSPEHDAITIIVTYRPATRAFGVFIKGRNLPDFTRTVRPDDILVGFNSRAFDHPFLCATFGPLMSQVAQLDLRWVLNGAGIKGPLKEVERTDFGVVRPAAIQGLSGEDAVDEWRRWTRTKDQRILDRLVLYAKADTFVLDFLAREICRRLGCARFTQPHNGARLFADSIPDAWPAALPPLPPRPEIANILQPADDVDPQEEEQADAMRRSHYEIIFLAALIDEMVTRHERRVLDLFASKYGIAPRVQEEIEQAARDQFNREGAASLLSRVLPLDDEWRAWYFEELAMFAWIDGILDKREEHVLSLIAQHCSINQERVVELKAHAVELGKELLVAN